MCDRGLQEPIMQMVHVEKVLGGSCRAVTARQSLIPAPESHEEQVGARSGTPKTRRCRSHIKAAACGAPEPPRAGPLRARSAPPGPPAPAAAAPTSPGAPTAPRPVPGEPAAVPVPAGAHGAQPGPTGARTPPGVAALPRRGHRTGPGSVKGGGNAPSLEGRGGGEAPSEPGGGKESPRPPQAQTQARGPPVRGKGIPAGSRKAAESGENGPAAASSQPGANTSPARAGAGRPTHPLSPLLSVPRFPPPPLPAGEPSARPGPHHLSASRRWRHGPPGPSGARNRNRPPARPPPRGCLQRRRSRRSRGGSEGSAERGRFPRGVSLFSGDCNAGGGQFFGQAVFWTARGRGHGRRGCERSPRDGGGATGAGGERGRGPYRDRDRVGTRTGTGTGIGIWVGIRIRTQDKNRNQDLRPPLTPPAPVSAVGRSGPGRAASLSAGSDWSCHLGGVAAVEKN